MTAAEGVNQSAPREAIAQAVREDILAGRLAPGDRLREADLAERFGVSRVPIREALSQLQSEGFVTLVRYRGATVSATSGEAALELLQIRRGLEVLAAQLAAERAGGDVADELSRVVELGRSATLNHAHDELPPLILRFHSLVAEAAGNHQLRIMLSQVLSRVSWIFDQRLESRTGTSWSDHAAIAQAILSGSPVQAGYLMGEHIARDEALLAELDHG
ncbi:GntR family transcriptional regulator [Prauserella cavernicola]|uniref:GntR family transcriptional regulator n=1 Tax=Prauserella cavernicola TaxID=2800127 RepID=A0A934R187_9PSEU|nr:GntR family transcriptional regulator [Prauserella cavernicola]MBK1789229.1 GntR family transcriptional regulator [Prauserella cavernicola]